MTKNFIYPLIEGESPKDRQNRLRRERPKHGRGNSGKIGRPRTYPEIEGETVEERSRRLQTESRRKKDGVVTPRPGGYKYPLIEGESQKDRANRIQRERKRFRRAESPEKAREERMRWQKEHPEAYRNGQLKRRYGITLEQYNRMLQEQEGVCKICGGKNEGKPLFVDHCHDTNMVRGLLCRLCNAGLGYLKHSSEILHSAADYLDFSFDPKKDLICV